MNDETVRFPFSTRIVNWGTLMRTHKLHERRWSQFERTHPRDTTPNKFILVRDGWLVALADLTDELLLGITILSRGGSTTVPKQVMKMLKLRYTPQKREKLLWTQKGDEIIVSKGTPQSSFRKTMLRRGGKAAVPRHIVDFLKLKSTLHKEERMLWIRKRDEIIVRKGTLQLNPTD